MRGRFLDDGEPLKGAAFELAQGATLGWDNDWPNPAPPHEANPPRPSGARRIGLVRLFRPTPDPGLHPGLFQIPPLWGSNR